MTKSGVEGAGAAGSHPRSVLASDVPASLVVFLVAVPLCMGIALASGAPIMSGLIAGVVGGLVVGLFGGAPLLVSGPAAGLAVMVFGFINEMGLAVTCAAVAAAGLVQMAMGGLKVARAALAISPAVIHGMLAGIGILIVLGQLHIVLGGAPQANAWQNMQGAAWADREPARPRDDPRPAHDRPAGAVAGDAQEPAEADPRAAGGGGGCLGGGGAVGRQREARGAGG